MEPRGSSLQFGTQRTDTKEHCVSPTKLADLVQSAQQAQPLVGLPLPPLTDILLWPTPSSPDTLLWLAELPATTRYSSLTDMGAELSKGHLHLAENPLCTWTLKEDSLARPGASLHVTESLMMAVLDAGDSSTLESGTLWLQLCFSCHTRLPHFWV